MTDNNRIKIILAIDTSCDDTSVALTRENFVLSNVVSSQIKLHRKWGGTVPMLAKREHEKRIDMVVAEAIIKSNVKKGIDRKRLLADSEYFKRIVDFVDAVAVTKGPGLAIALEVGIKKAKELAILLNKPLIGVDHMEGHLLSALMNNQIELERMFPALGVLVSGGHTEFIKVSGVGEYEKIGGTVDDAIGEAFDKVARVLDLGYPGGPIISELAKLGDPNKYPLPIAMKGSSDLNVSYSGSKTAVLYLVRDLKGESRVQVREKRQSYDAISDMKEKSQGKIENAEINTLTRQEICDICASFQKAALETVVYKVKKALHKYEFNAVLLGGGASNNLELRQSMRKTIRSINKINNKNLQLHIPYTKKLFQDNAAMIGNAAYLGVRFFTNKLLNNNEGIDELDRDPSKKLG